MSADSNLRIGMSDCVYIDDGDSQYGDEKMAVGRSCSGKDIKYSQSSWAWVW